MLLVLPILISKSRFDCNFSIGAIRDQKAIWDQLDFLFRRLNPPSRERRLSILALLPPRRCYHGVTRVQR